ncbi:hypothetical protein ABZ816_26910 [Actinosynnema sp. NPDC047251]|uniref:Secreted protein n=1 Tax=Saccharothrix espanaensis (strain ATCC 51144 / DSM 44229 / JCM 9112 / NBRC 15066 / NRRL 15764) TaxID=1179773 RepID=K0K5Z4_SACES|nr:hypothetical protein [Saccharothrix espanaensis]CCH31978.1 hypothetical protein BN6_46990 [Saccharothrix espanaensis DSM 44229]
MRAGRLWCLSASALVLWIATPVGAAENPPRQALPVDFDRTVHGDVAVIGNAVLGCPPDDDRHEAQFPARLCREAQTRRGTGVSAQNNGHWMTWTDEDDDPATYNSSTASLEVPAGASVAYAKLGWAGTTGASPTAPCGRGGEQPPGTAAGQAPVLAVAGTKAVLGPGRFTYASDGLGSLGRDDQQFYSAQADVTAEFRAVATGRPIPVTVGNIWTPQGRDCFAGWTLTVVWSFDRAHQQAPAPRHVTLHGGHVRVLSKPQRVTVRLDAPRPTGGRARIGVTAYEGDWAQAGDLVLVGGQPQADPAGGAENFFAGYAQGDPHPVNNLSVDAKVVQVPAPSGSATVVDLVTRADAYLLQGLAVSMPLPELAATISPDRPAAHAGESVDHTVRVANTGEAPARDLAARIGGSDCGPLPDELAGGASATTTCRTRVGSDDHRVTVEVTGSSLAGDRLATTAAAPVEVLRPALRVSQSFDPDTVVEDHQVALDVRVENTGDTPLSGLRIDHDVLDPCDRADAGTVEPGRTATFTCRVEPGAAAGTDPVTDPVTDTVTVTASDGLGLAATASATADFSVVHPLLTVSAVWSADTVGVGEPVAITVRVGNPSRVAFHDVAVEGEPAACRRPIGELAAGEAVTYTCDVVLEQSLITDLTAVGAPRITGVTPQEVRRSASTPVRVAVRPAPGRETPAVREPASAPPAQRLPAEPVAREQVYAVRDAPPADKPAIALVAVAAGMAVMVVTASALAAARRS